MDSDNRAGTERKAAAASPQRPEERKLNLYFALTKPGRYRSSGLTIEWIGKNVVGYQHKSPDALRRLISRDVKQLVLAGVPISRHTDDNGQMSYRANTSQLELSQVRFTEQEAAIVSLAGAAGSDHELSAFSRSGWTKLVAAGRITYDGDAKAHMRFLTDIRDIDEADIRLVQRAKRLGKVIRFSFRKTPVDDAEVRVVEPWGYVVDNDKVYLVGYDRHREQPRCFRVNKISDVKTLKATCTQPVPPAEKVRRVVVMARSQDTAPITAIVRVVAPRDGARVDLPIVSGATRLDESRWKVTTGRDAIVRAALEHAGDIVIESPDDLREEVISALTHLARTHE